MDPKEKATTETMTLRKALKELPLIIKKVTHNIARIQEISSICSNELPPYGTEDECKKQVKGLRQANSDLIDRYLDIKKRVLMTNLKTKVRVKDQEFFLFDLLEKKRTLHKLECMTVSALNTNSAKQRLAAIRTPNDKDGNPVLIKPMFDEKERDKLQMSLIDFEHESADVLEILNTNTSLLPLE